ncbi:MAG: C40 family peptidase [Planktomarina sp.]
MDQRSTFGTDLIADIALKKRHKAKQYVIPKRMQVLAPVLDLTFAGTSQLQRQLLMGDVVDVLTPDAPRSLIRDENSAYVGWADVSALGPYTPTNAIITARSTFLFTKPDFKCPNPMHISMGSRITIKDETERFYQTACDRFVPKGHVCQNTDVENSLDLLQSLLGTPYLWGGNSAFGIDCSGLAQMFSRLEGIPCPGDSDQQSYGMGVPLDLDAPSRPGDLWFWKGHVAVSLNEDTLIHANAHHMSTSLEPIQKAVDRIEMAGDGHVTARRRILY